MPGDDLSTIDWKVYARSDRYYVKKFDEETNVECHVLLDVSGSMGYGSASVTKLAYGSFLAASLAYLMHRQRDAVGFMAFDDDIVTHLAASARPGHLRSVLLALDQVSLGRRSNVAKPLHQLADALTKRGIVVLLSDLLDEPDRIIQGLKHLRFRGADVVVFHLLDDDELSFPFERLTRFRDLETTDEVMAAPLEVRNHYLREIGSLVSRYKRELRLVGIDYQLVKTSKPLDFALMRYLSTRSRRH